MLVMSLTLSLGSWIKTRYSGIRQTMCRGITCYSGTQDTLFQDCKRMLFNCDLEILKLMWPEVCMGDSS